MTATMWVAGDLHGLLDRIDRRLGLVEQIAAGAAESVADTGTVPVVIIDDGTNPPVFIDTRPPGDVLNVRVTVGAFFDSIYADVAWDKPTETLSGTKGATVGGYEIEIAEGVTHGIINSFSTAAENYRIENLEPNHAYAVRVHALSLVGRHGAVSDWIEFNSGADTTIPAAPTGLVVFRAPNALIARWNGNNEADVKWGHGTYRAEASTDNFATIAASIITSATVVSFDGINAEAVYKVRVYAIDSSGNEGPPVTSGNVLAGMIIDTMLADNSVRQSALKDAIINNAKLVDGAVNAAKIAVAAITTTKIADDAISTPKLQAGSVQAGTIAADAVIAGKIATDAVTAREILARSIGANEISAGSITSYEIAASTITAYNIAAGTITAGQIAAGTITAAQIQFGSITGDRITANSIDAAKIQSFTILSASLTINGDLQPGPSSGSIRVGNFASGGSSGVLMNNLGLRGYNNGAIKFSLDTSGSFAASGMITASTVQSTWFQCVGCGMYDNYGCYFLVGPNGYVINRALYWQDASNSIQYWRQYAPNASQFVIERVNVQAGQYSEMDLKANSFYFNAMNGDQIISVIWTSASSAGRQLNVNGTLGATTKNFLIDHPLAPTKKLLQHSCVEGPEVTVYYRGKAALVNGEAIVVLPDYFEALTFNEDRTVQVTPIEDGSAPPSLRVSYPKDGKFKVYGDEDSNAEFFWMVNAVRKDVPKLEVEYNKADLAGAAEWFQLLPGHETTDEPEPGTIGAPQGRTLAQVQAGYT